MKMSHDDFEAWVREQSRACLEPREIDALCEGDLDPDSGEYTFREQAVQGQWEAWRAASEFHSLFVRRRRRLNWDFDGEGAWEAPSSIGDDGDPFEWRIVVCDDGTFSVGESDSELTDRKETFDSLPEAKEWCAARDEEIRLGDANDES